MKNEPASYQIIAPISGKIIELSTVPDPVFSEKLTGDGLGTEPRDLQDNRQHPSRW
nr:PTS glucose transporter subunit IIA [uncultured Selenomonas sp.]